jgi:predicted nucleotidyltransferase
MSTVLQIYPVLARIVGEEWASEDLEEFARRCQRYCTQLEQDLSFLTRSVEEKCLISCFRKKIRDKHQRVEAIYEIYTAATFSYISDAPIELHVPKSDDVNSKDFDLRVRIKDCVINVEITTRKDDSVFKKGRKLGEGGWFLSRATVDSDYWPVPEDEDLGKKISVSKEMKQLIEKEMAQLPERGPNVVVIGEIQGFLEHGLGNALYGDQVGWFDKAGWSGSERLPDGLFSGLPGFEAFNKLNAVIWLKLAEYGSIKRYSKIYFNPHANTPFSPEVEESLIQAFDREKYLHEELERIRVRIIERYDPEKIILFGSLASGNVHEWSDIDLVVIKQTSKPYFQRLKELALLTRPKVGVNFFVYTPSEVEKMESDGNFFIVEEILGKGRLLYDRARGLARSGAG